MNQAAASARPVGPRSRRGPATGAAPPVPLPEAGALLERYEAVRAFTESLCRPLAVEDHVVQSMPDCSPTRWHLAHTTWFFETFVVKPMADGYREVDARYEYLFNSYYNAVGEQFARDMRGLLSRPTVADVYAYRWHVDEELRLRLGRADAAWIATWAPLLELGLHHEQQHQELILTDIKHVFSVNPLLPAYAAPASPAAPAAAPLQWHEVPGGLVEIGHAPPGFAYDNEAPRHPVYLAPFRLASRLVTAGEYRAFIDASGYRRPELWLSAGWNMARDAGWEAPLYWRLADGEWRVFTLEGERPLAEAEPVCHVSYYEADAYARWEGVRLPTEAEWETAARHWPRPGRFAESGRFHPAPAPTGEGPEQLLGDAWEWTASAYLPYPGYRPDPGALGEYNGKFMCNQFVLRGGSCATPASHIRPTYRNFFPPEARWQFSGIRLAADAAAGA